MKPSVTLKENYEFRRLYQRGASAVGGGMVIYCRRNRLGRSRLGLTVSVKIGNAVKRNRARRRLREVYRINSPRLKQGWDMVLVARGRTLTAPWKELNETFLRLCRKLDLLTDSQTSSAQKGRAQTSCMEKERAEKSCAQTSSAQKSSTQTSRTQRKPEKRDGFRNAEGTSGTLEDKL